MIYIETERLILRNHRPDDLDDFFAYMSLEYTALHEDFDPLTRKEAAKLLNRRLDRDDYQAVELKENGRMIGDLSYREKAYDTYEIGYDFNVQYEKHGYATEACTALLRHLFTQRNARRIVAECNEENENSWRLLERLGFRREALHLEDVAFKTDDAGNPIYVNSYVYALLGREWTP